LTSIALARSRSRKQAVREADLEVEAAEHTRTAHSRSTFPDFRGPRGSLRGQAACQLEHTGATCPCTTAILRRCRWRLSSRTCERSDGDGRPCGRGRLTAIQPVFAGAAFSTVTVSPRSASSCTRQGDHGEARRTRTDRGEILATAHLSEKRKTLASYDTLLAELDKQANDAVRAGLSTRNDKLKVDSNGDGSTWNASGSRPASGSRHATCGIIWASEGAALTLGDSLGRPVNPTRSDQHVRTRQTLARRSAYSTERRARRGTRQRSSAERCSRRSRSAPVSTTSTWPVSGSVQRDRVW